MFKCPHGCMHDQFCMCIMEIMWGIPLSLNRLPNKHPWHTSCLALYKPVEHSSAINLDLGWELLPLPSEEGTKGSPKKEDQFFVKLKVHFKSGKKRKRNSRSKIGRKKKEKEILDQRSEERKRKRKLSIKDRKKAKGKRKKRKFPIRDWKKTK